MIELQSQEETFLQSFRNKHHELFQKSDARLFLHLGTVLSLLFFSTALAIRAPVWLKIPLGAWNALLWFSLVNVTIHHHHTHHNAASSDFAKAFLDFLYLVAIPNGPKRRTRYARAHLNHHARPFHETDVDHFYGTHRYLKMMKSAWTRLLYFLELTFIGAHVPGWNDDRYMSEVPLEMWNCEDYQKVKEAERREAMKTALIQWGMFLVILAGAHGRAPLLEIIVWGWAYPMLLVKNWAHFLGQFQHYDARLLEADRTVWNRTRTFHFPSWLNYLVGGEISGHFLHHLFPELPYYRVEELRKKLVEDPEFSRLFVTY